jgi:uncharacterized membrane protein YeaQ/YmgE (transglycosylase-associated protein family)
MVVVLVILALIIALWLLSIVVGFLINLALLFTVAFLAGLAAQSWLKYPGGITGAFVSGLIGGVVGILLARLLGAPTLLTIGGLPVLWTVVGAVIVVAIAKVALPQRADGQRFLR